MLNAKLFSAFSGARARIDRTVGGAFSLFDDHIVGKNVELVPNQRIVQAWRAANWPDGASSTATFEIKARGSGTRLVFDHTGFPEGLHDHLAEGWENHYWEPLGNYHRLALRTRDRWRARKSRRAGSSLQPDRAVVGRFGLRDPVESPEKMSSERPVRLIVTDERQPGIASSSDHPCPAPRASATAAARPTSAPTARRDSHEALVQQRDGFPLGLAREGALSVDRLDRRFELENRPIRPLDAEFFK